MKQRNFIFILKKEGQENTKDNTGKNSVDAGTFDAQQKRVVGWQMEGETEANRRTETGRVTLSCEKEKKPHLPGQAATVEVHEHIAQRLHVVTPALLCTS